MTTVRQLRWNPDVVAHIARHDVTPEEVEEVRRGDSIQSPAHTGRIVIIGPTRAGRILTVVIAHVDEGVYDGDHRASGQPQGAAALFPAAPSGRAIMNAAEEQHQAQTHSRIPTFASIEEERAFWDTHDVTDYWDESESVDLQPAQPIVHSVSFKIDIETLSGLIELGKQRGVEPLTLAAEWLAERVRAEQQRD